MKRRRRNPQTATPPRKNPVRGLFREALINALDADFRHHRMRRRPNTWSSASSDGQESLAASSLDKYVRAVLDEKCSDKKVRDSPKPRSHTQDTEDFKVSCQKKDSTFPSPLSKSRNEERWTSGFSINDKDPLADWTRHRFDHNHHQPHDFQIRGKEGGWKSIKGVFRESSKHSLVSVITMHQIGVSLNPMSPSNSHPIYLDHIGRVEPMWRATVQIRTSPSMPSVLVDLASTMMPPGAPRLIIGRDLFEKLYPMNPGWTSSGLDTSTSSIKDDNDDDDDISQGRLNNQQKNPQTSDVGSTWSELSDSELELSSKSMEIDDESRALCEWLGGAYEAV